MNILVFDANVPWDLDEKIDKLDEVMRAMNNINLKIYISNINFNEMPYGVQRNIRKHGHVVIDNDSDENEYVEFKKDIHRKGIILSDADSAVLFISHKLDADFIISSDRRLLLMAKEYAKFYNKKVKPFHLIEMFDLIYRMNLMESNSCIKMSIKLYKNKELIRMIKEHGAELILDKIKRNDWITNEIKSSVDTFNIYERYITGYLR